MEKDVNLWRLYQGNSVRAVKTDESIGMKLNFYFRFLIVQCESFPPGKIDGQFIDLVIKLMILISQ